MALTTEEMMTTAETMIFSNDTNKRKFIDTESSVKRCKISSPTTTYTDEDSNAVDFAEVSDNDSNTSVQSDKPIHTIEYSQNCESMESIVSPQYGQIVNRREFRRAGPYIIGLKIGHSPVDSIVQYLAKKENTNEFVQLKVSL